MLMVNRYSMRTGNLLSPYVRKARRAWLWRLAGNYLPGETEASLADLSARFKVKRIGPKRLRDTLRLYSVLPVNVGETDPTKLVYARQALLEAMTNRHAKPLNY